MYDLCNDIIDSVLTNLLRYLDPQDSWGQMTHAHTVYTRPSFSIETGLESRLIYTVH